jgi:hypothetical protein
MLRSAQAIAILSGSLFMAGCQTSGARFARLNEAIKVPEAVPALQRAEGQLAAGRDALGQRNYAAAITAFRAASVEQSVQPAAQNGLGVAFAGIGREDLAELHFRKAISLDPANARYEENLARLYRVQLTAALARRDKTEARERASAARSQAETKRRLANGISVMVPGHRIVRSTNGTAMIQGVQTGARADAVAIRRASPVALSTSSGRPEALPALQPAVITSAGLRVDHVRPVTVLAAASVPVPVSPDPTAATARPAFAAAHAAVVSAPGLRTGAVTAVSSPGLRPGAAVAVLERARSPITIVGQLNPVLARMAGSATPETDGVATTGRLYVNSAKANGVTAIESPHDRSTVQLASNQSIATTILGPISVRKSILGFGADVAAADATLADLP